MRFKFADSSTISESMLYVMIDNYTFSILQILKTLSTKKLKDTLSLIARLVAGPTGLSVPLPVEKAFL